MFARTLLTCAFLISGAVPDLYACSVAGPEPTNEALFRKASTVFAARVVRAEEAPAQLSYSKMYETIIEGTFRIVEVLKGEPPADQKIRSFPYGPGNCTIPILAGADYVFFLYGAEDSFVSWPGGSRMVWSFKIGAGKDLLSELRALKN